MKTARPTTYWLTAAVLGIVLALAELAPAQPIDPLTVPLAQGESFVDDDPSAVFSNPAMAPQFSRGWGDAVHQRLFWGIGEALYRSRISLTLPNFRRGIRVNFCHQGAPIERRWKLGVSYALKLTTDATAQQATNREGLFAGLSAELLDRGYSEDNMALAQPDPLFAGGKTSKIAPDISVGAVWHRGNTVLQAGIFHLLFPNLALAGTDRIPVAVQLGAITIRGNLTAQINLRYSPRYGSFPRDFDAAAGISYPIAKNFVASARVSNHSIGAKAAFVPNFARNIAVEYELSYPIDGIKIPSHRFGIKYLFKPLEPIFPDVVPGKLAVVGKPVPGETLTVKIPIVNRGKFKTPEIPVAIKFGDSALVSAAGELAPGQSETLTVKIPAGNPGDTKISVFLNRTKPSRNAEVSFVEKDPNNDFADTTIHIFAPPKPELLVERPELHLIQKFSIAEDEPLVPIFFFEQNDSTLDPRFDRTIEIIGKRLAQNPDIWLEIAGFVIDGEPDSLAFARARAVKRAFAAKFPSIAQRLKISTDHDIHRLRAKKEKFQGTRAGKIFTPQENRRVELYARLTGENRFSLAAGQIPPDSVISYIIRKLDSNPELILVVRADSIRNALKYKEKLMALLPQRLEDRVFSQEGYDRGVKLILNPTGLIYRPPQVIQPAEGYQVEPGWDRVKFRVEPHAECAVKSAKIIITDGADTIRQFADTLAEWDWRLDDGSYPPPGAKFSARAQVVDSLGQAGLSPEKQLSVVVENINEVQQRLILLQFAFAGKQSESEYTNARMEYVARRVIERISAGDVDVIVAGHTDTIGTFAGNQKLSEKRAEEQLKILRKYLRAILNFDSDAQLDRWIAEHNATLRAKGFGMSQPYTITRLSDGTERKILLGINTLPEGRIKNRRVEILFIPRKKTAGN